MGKVSALTFEEVRHRYEHFRSRCVEKDKSTVFEKGCTTPFYGKKAKCVINIVPNDTLTPTFSVDPKCLLKK